MRLCSLCHCTLFHELLGSVTDFFFLLSHPTQPRMDQYFTQMEKIIKEKKTSSRIRFMLLDVLDLRRVNVKFAGEAFISIGESITCKHHQNRGVGIPLWVLSHDEAAGHSPKPPLGIPKNPLAREALPKVAFQVSCSLTSLRPLPCSVTGCPVEETRVRKPSTRSTRTLRWKSTGSRPKSSSSSCPKRTRVEEEVAAGWVEVWAAGALTHREVAGAACPKMRAGTLCPSQRDPTTPLASRSLR